MRTIQQFFYMGMDRHLPPLAQPPAGLTLELGPGQSDRVPTDEKLRWPEWDAARELRKIHTTPGNWELEHLIPYPDGLIAEIHAYHFFEHLTGEHAIRLLLDIQRVLKPGGVLNVVTPYYNSNLQAHALDHKSFWCEDTWDWLFNQDYYTDHTPEGGWRLTKHFCIIMGIVERNLCLMTQIVRT